MMKRFPFHALLAEPFSKHTRAFKFAFAFLIAASLLLTPPFPTTLQV